MHDLTCPICGDRLRRVHRRLIDKAISELYPLKRYRCRNRQCSWEGNLSSTQRGRSRLQTWGFWALIVLAAVLLGKFLGGFV